jgi:hypothetical protein
MIALLMLKMKDLENFDYRQLTCLIRLDFPSDPRHQCTCMKIETPLRVTSDLGRALPAPVKFKYVLYALNQQNLRNDRSYPSTRRQKKYLRLLADPV